jgi:hypothetical protein
MLFQSIGNRREVRPLENKLADFADHRINHRSTAQSRR